jgi:hypothetical protein
LNLDVILSDIRKHADDIGDFSSTIGDLMYNGAALNDIAAFIANTDSGNQKEILQRAKSVKTSLDNIQTLLAIASSTSSITSDRNTLIILAEIASVGSTVSKNTPIAQTLTYFGSATQGIYSGLKQYTFHTALNVLDQIAIQCYECEAEPSWLLRLNNLLNF